MWKLIDEPLFAMIRQQLIDRGSGETAAGKLAGGGAYLELGRGGVSLIRREFQNEAYRYFIWEASR